MATSRYNVATMTTVSVRELKSRLGDYLRRAHSGEHILVTNRGKPVAELSAPPKEKLTADEKLEQMERQGLITRPTRPFRLPERMISLRGEGPSLSEMVLRDRGEPLP